MNASSLLFIAVASVLCIIGIVSVIKKARSMLVARAREKVNVTQRRAESRVLTDIVYRLVQDGFFLSDADAAYIRTERYGWESRVNMLVTRIIETSLRAGGVEVPPITQ